MALSLGLNLSSILLKIVLSMIAVFTFLRALYPSQFLMTAQTFSCFVVQVSFFISYVLLERFPYIAKTAF